MTEKDRLVHTVTKLIKKLFVTPEGKYYWRRYASENVCRDSEPFDAMSDEAAIKRVRWNYGPWKYIDPGDETE